MRHAIHNGIHGIRHGEEAFSDPSCGCQTGKQSPADSEPRVSARSAHQNERRHSGSDYDQLHRLDTQVESQKVGDTLPPTQSQFAERRREGQAVNQAEKGRDAGLASRTERTQGVNRGNQNGNCDQHFIGTARHADHPQRGQRERDRMARGKGCHHSQNVQQARAQSGEPGPARAQDH